MSRWWNMLPVLVFTVLLGASAIQVPSQTGEPALGTIQGALLEIKGKRRAKFLVIRSEVVNAKGDSSDAAIAAITSGRDTEQKHWLAYSVIARKLNKYIRQYKTMTAAEGTSEVDFYIVFNLAGYRRTINGIYASGELFVIAPSPSGSPRILWRSEKEMFAEDAASSLIRALKVVYGQK
jgi:hypothetical protein